MIRTAAAAASMPASVDESAGATLVIGAQHPFPPYAGENNRGSSVTAVTAANAAVSMSTRLKNTSTSVGPGSYENGVGEWTKCEELGRGAHGIVYRGVVADTGENIAVKQFQRSGAGSADLKAAENEIGLLPRFQHPNVVRFLGIERAGEHLNIFLEYLDGGSLRRRLEKDGPMSEDQTANTTKKVLSGLSYLHSKDITHRDIKGANVLLSQNGAVKLADFGTSKLVDQASVVSGLKGTPKWMAPEVIRNQLRPGGWLQADVWSVGCTVVEMLTGKVPWPDMPHPLSAMYKIGLGEKPPIDRHISPEARSFIAACCCSEPSQRYTVEQLMNHPFLARPRSPRPGGTVQTACPSPRPHRLEDGSRHGGGGGPWSPASTDARQVQLREWRWKRPQPTDSPSSPNSDRSDGSGDNNIAGRGGGNSGDVEDEGCNRRNQEAAEDGARGVSSQGGRLTRRPPCRSRETAKSKESRWPRKGQCGWNGDVAGEAGGDDQSQAGQQHRGHAESRWRGNAVGTPIRTAGRFRAPPRGEGDGSRRRRQQQQQQQQTRGHNSDMCNLLECGMKGSGDSRSCSNSPALSPAPLPPSPLPPPGPTSFSSPICQLRYNTGSPSSSEAIYAPKFEEAPIEYSSSPGGGGRGGAGWTMGNSTGGRGSTRSGDRGLGATAGSGSGSGSNGIVSPLEHRYINREKKSNATHSVSKPQKKQQQQQQQHQQQQRKQHQQQQQQVFPERHTVSVPEPESPSGMGGGGLPLTFTDSWNHVPCYDGNQSEEEQQQQQQQQQDFNPVVESSRVSKLDRRSRVVSYNSPIVTSPVVTLGRQMSSTVLTGTTNQGAAEFDDGNGRRPSGSSNNASSRWGSAYNRPFQVVQAAREDMMGREGERDQARPEGPITGEYMKLEKQRGLQVQADGSVPSRGSGRGRWRSNSMPSPSMRTKSAGVLGASSKLPPLERDVPGGGATGGREGGGGGGVMGGFRSGSVGMRLVTSAPTPVESFLPTAPAAAAAVLAAKLPVMVSKGPGSCSVDRVSADQPANRSAARSSERSADRNSNEVFDDPYTAADSASSAVSAAAAAAAAAKMTASGSPREAGMLRRRASLAPIRANFFSASSTQASGVPAAASTTAASASAAGMDDRASIARSTGGGGERSGVVGDVGDGGFPSRSTSTTRPLSAWGSAHAAFPDLTDGRIFSGIQRERVKLVGSGGDVARGSSGDVCRVASVLPEQASTAASASAAAAAAAAAAGSLHCSSSMTGRLG